jgi:hypothetical protein
VGGLFIGAVLGRWLGGLVAVGRHGPAAGEAPVPRIRKGVIAALGFLGAIAGVAVGMVLTAVFVRDVRSGWLVPVLFFLPPVLGLILGAFAGLSIARRRSA